MIKNLILIVFTITSFIYCFRFGLIITAYGHGGQLLGIPFAIITLGLTLLYLKVKKKVVWVVAFSYFVALAGCSITIELIRENMNDSFQFLYSGPTHWSNIILLTWILFGVISTIIYVVKKND